ncbi:ankyrin repeat-containing domain protein [Apodospora peruviana]|uniref:Ankyrin repeat-containing domain protein n=1 Tax=Apodospora peruviana TaxID=516989 RepID=A0AAE0ME78_9PEZI|nr:ankyrin repeat-containing domain protein [Apodospora peruviana]
MAAIIHPTVTTNPQLSIPPTIIDSIMREAEAGNAEGLDHYITFLAEGMQTTTGHILWAVRDSMGHTVLHRNAATGEPGIIALLEKEETFGDNTFEQKAFWYERNHGGLTAALVGCQNDRTHYIDRLVEAGGLHTLNAVDHNGFGAVHYAANHNMAGVIKHVVETYDCRANARGPNDLTPAHVAARRDHVESFEVLAVFCGCDLRPNVSGYTPVDFAVKYRSEKILEFLGRFGVGRVGVDPQVSEAEERAAKSGMALAMAGGRMKEAIYCWMVGFSNGVVHDDDDLLERSEILDEYWRAEIRAANA